MATEIASVFGEPRRKTDGQAGFELKAVGSDSQSFQDWMQHATDAHVLNFFRAAAMQLDQRLALDDYHWKLLNGRYDRIAGRQTRWDVVVYYGEDVGDDEGPLQVSVCNMTAACINSHALHGFRNNTSASSQSDCMAVLLATDSIEGYRS